jgi:restriction endonuclease Mrr
MDNLVVLMFTFSLCGAIIYLHSICISKLRRWDAKKAQQQQAVQLDYDQRKREQAQLREEQAQRQRVVWEEQARQAQCERAVREQQRLAQLSSLQDLYNLTSQVFETEVAQMFRRLGWTVQQTPFSNDRGRDAIMTNGKDKVLLECKKYAPEQMSGRPELQKFHSAIVTDHAERGKFVTTSGFSLAAREYVTANNLPIDLIEGHNCYNCSQPLAARPAGRRKPHGLYPSQAGRES